jgi:ankyrin repeat protein
MIRIHAEGESHRGCGRIGWGGLRACGLILCLWLALGTSVWAKSGDIHKAVANGDLNKVVALLNGHPELVESRNSLGLTPLHVAVMHHQVEAAALLLANGADVNARDPHQQTPLLLAMFTYNHDKMMRLLLAKGADVNLSDSGNMTPVFYAVQQGQIDDVKLLIANDANINFVAGMTPLVSAVMKSNVELVELLLQSGADPNHIVNGYPALHYAGNPKVAALLISYGGTNAVAKPGELDKAVVKGELSTVASMIKNHPDALESRNSLGQAPLHVAVIHNQLQIAELLLANGADVNARDAHQKTPLMLAMFTFNHDPMVGLLLAKGAEVNLTDAASMTALAYAAQSGQVEDAKILIANDANINFVLGATSLYFAVMGSHREMVSLLLENGAEVDHKVGGYSPLHWAEYVNETTRKFSDPKIVETIKSYGGHE